MTSARETVFIVGAGASAEFGFPVGSGLAENIKKTLQGTVQYTKVEAYGYRYTGIEHWLKRLSDSKKFEVWEVERAVNLIVTGMPYTPSIDVFVNNHNEDRAVAAVAKIAIAYEILRNERGEGLSTGSVMRLTSLVDRKEFAQTQVRNTWLGQLWQLIVSAGKKRDVEALLGRIGFVVFNYDRSIEQFFYYTLMHYFNLQPDEARRMFRQLDIIHMYGQAGRFKPIEDGLAECCDYGEPNPEKLPSRVDEQLVTFSEARSEEINTQARATEMIRQAKVLTFLGFQFYEQNMALLFDDTLPKDDRARRAYGTCFGMAEPLASVVRYDLMEKKYITSIEPITAHELIRSYGQAMFR
ncbi:hypothetical protein GWI72_00900 [Microvirga tunisiensis]|uniref:SIR2-like domain-containing protein n=1 Tax=Pannonibacter tanglangensis TaxID=2750084 RepID=A0A7X5EZ80_9HYPH|nr:hypothetical protein [Pannonibacter sp. XCT-53]NBN76821.1 hypothetical protein [Pannonibacter sp. XCT-53]